MLNRHVGYYFLSIIPCVGCVRLPAVGLLSDGVNVSVPTYITNPKLKEPYGMCVYPRPKRLRDDKSVHTESRRP